MALKRSFHGDDGLGVLGPKIKRRLTFKNAVLDVLKGISVDDVLVRMEPFLRKIVREEMERATLAFSPPTARTSLNQVEKSERGGLQLLFANKVPSPIFTGSRIEAEDGGPVQIVLMDTNSKTVVKTGPHSSMKIEIVVLDGDFCSDDQEDWTENEFRAKIVREREGKRPLVTGELYVTLREGVAALGEIVFTDNSSWMRCRKFRLGARVSQRSGGEVRIKEGRSEAFVVKDHRGELYKKHYPPSLDDEIWRLEKIAKDGAFHERLTDNQVKNVRDFLRLLKTNPTLLRKILGGSTRTWETIVEHATTCVVDDEKYYAYYGDTDGVALLFNAIYELVAAAFDGKSYQSLDKLTFNQKLSVENLKKHAYKHVKDFVLIDARTISGPSRALTPLQAEPFSCPSILQHHEFPVAQQEMQLDFNHALASTSYAYEAPNGNQFQLSLAQNTPPIQVFNPELRDSFTMTEFFSTPYSEENSWSSGNSQGQIVPSCNLAVDSMSQGQMSTWPPVNGIWGQGNGFFFSSTNDLQLDIDSSPPNLSVHFSRAGKPKVAWCKIRAAVFWGSLNRGLAARRMARPFYFDHLLDSSI